MEITPEVDMSDYDRLGCLHEMFVEQAQKTPNAVAVVSSCGTQTTFKELDAMSDFLARVLQQLGVTTNKVVGILMERSLEYTVSVIGIHKAGGAYLPLEVSYPLSLLNSVLEDSRPKVICTKTNFLQRFNGRETENNDNYAIIDMNDFKKDYLENKSTDDSDSYSKVKVGLDDMAYTVYSSGTTGRPKGIQCPHRGAVFSYTWRHRAYPYVKNDREACNVFFVWEMLRPLLKGMPMYIAPDDVIYDPPRLIDFIEKFQITRMLYTPSLMQAVLDFHGLDLTNKMKSMRQIVFCGEVVTTALRDRVANRMPWIQLLNLYSISECHDVANSDISKRMSSGEPRKFCPVGKIFPQVHIVVMDENKNVKNTGEQGEIYVGGPTLAIGYLNRPELNAERFIDRPSHVNPEVGAKLYRTGDWGFVLSDGSLEICGRCDSAVRIRGYSVELQAIERIMLDLPEINACCVMAHAQEEEDDEKYLVAFVVIEDVVKYNHNNNSSNKNSEIGTMKYSRSIRLKMRDRLPPYMIPSKFVYLQKIPILEASGKLDKKSLLAQLNNTYKNSSIDDSKKLKLKSAVLDLQGQILSETQLKVANIWASILKLYTIDIEENFFDLGGHSLAATRLISEINQAFNSAFSVRDVFQYPTIEGLSSIIDGKSNIDVEINLVDELKTHSQFLDSFIDMDKKLSAFWKTIKINKNSLYRGNILLTGSTGFIASHLLYQLLTTTQSVVYCIVREHTDLSPIDRIVKAQKFYGLPDRQELIDDRVIAVKGDVSLLNFGLSDDIYTLLTYNVDAVIHASAQVNLILPYRALYKDNVLATKNIIQFSLINKFKYVSYISTTSVFPDGHLQCDENTDMFSFVNDLNTGYSQTKWLAEQLVIKAGRAGLPITIYRCGNISGALDKPCWNPSDFTLYMLQGVLYTSCAPSLDWKIELTPIDFLRDIVIRLYLDIDSSAGKIFHVIDDKTLQCRELWKLMTELGYNLKLVTYNEWLNNLSNVNKLEKISQLLQYLAKNEDYFINMTTYKRTNLDKYLNKISLSYPVSNNELFRVYIKHLCELHLIPSSEMIEKEDILQKLRVENNHSFVALPGIHGKVILVTGASSGIGSGIAFELALSGAKVILASRNIDKLHILTETLKLQGVKNVLPVKIDVTNIEEVKKVIKQIEAKWGPIDVLINNAGCMYYQYMKNCNIKEWNHMVELNCNGTLNCLATVLSTMVNRKSGHIITITSDAGRKAFPGLAVYSGTKFFLEGLCSALRMELSNDNIKVTCIQPGDVESNIRMLTSDTEASKAYDFSKNMKILKPQDIGKAVIYALTQPDYCAINEILIEPKEAPI